MEGMPRAALFVAVGGRWELGWPLFFFLQGPRATLWHPCVNLPLPPPHPTSHTIFLGSKDSECLACNFLSFFLPAIKFSSIQQIITKTCQEPSPVLGAFKGQTIWSPVPAHIPAQMIDK